ncbi:MAG: hypothetical protein AAGG55_10195 [Pseudomonadota bacterium]
MNSSDQTVVAADTAAPGSTAAPGGGGKFFSTAPKQLIKIAVYSLLIVNFFHYLSNDIDVARHTMHDGWTLKDWTTAFATTFDELAWFLLLFLLELETFLLSDEAFTRGRVMLMHALRLVCFVAIGHTVFAFADYLLELDKAVVHSGADLCQFVGMDLSFARNLAYSELDGANCATLTNADTLFQFAQGQALTDAAGWQIEWELAWADLIEVVVWLFIIAMIEVMVRLQDKGVTRGPVIRFARLFNACLYSVLWVTAAYWAYRGHWVFAWDETLWILGFMAIGMNLSDWRKEMEAEEA